MGYGSRFLRIGQAADYVGLSRATLYRYEEQGFLQPYLTLGGHRRYRRVELDEFVKNRGSILALRLRDRREKRYQLQRFTKYLEGKYLSPYGGAVSDR